MWKLYIGDDFLLTSFLMWACGILAGGSSSRMGRNKALMEFQGKPLIQRQIDLLSPMFDEILIGANDPTPYAPFNRRVVPDLLSERCALTGIHALLRATTDVRIFVLACDMPYLQPKLIATLMAVPPDVDVVVPESDRGLEPLHAVYRKSCLRAIEESARRGSWKATDFYANVAVERIRVKDAEWSVDGRSPFLNVNTPEEWRTAAP